MTEREHPNLTINPADLLPTITADLPGIGGEIKAEPEHFVVQEIPLYEASGEGEHIYLSITRAGQNTHDLQRNLAQLYDLKPNDVGCAGRKDKQALVTQTFSLPLYARDPAEVAAQVSAELGVTVNWAQRHRNKLKPGHLLGNHFRIVVQGVPPAALEPATTIAQHLAAQGLPNYYGAQRFGTDGDNALRGRETLLGQGPRQRWLRNFLLGAYQAHLFNQYLAARIQRGWFGRLLAGDIAKKLDTGGLFTVVDADVEQPRFESWAITYTGPIYGAKTKPAEGLPGELEAQILAAQEIPAELFKKARLDGSRRPGRIRADDLSIEVHPDGLLFSFNLPKGSYATVLLREFTKLAAGTLPDES